MVNSIVLSVGERVHLKQGKDQIIYAGMPSEDVYSIAEIKRSGYQGYAWNLYFPRKKQDILVDGVGIFVENATPDDIRLRIQ